MLKIKSSKILKSIVNINDAPKTNLPEFVMIGRSNVGKSSFINTICNRKNLAYKSKTPGKTRLINLYQINEDFIIADLPGYGYAKRSKEELQIWQKRIEDYILNRKQIICTVHLIDARHEIQKNDIQMRQWLNFYNVPLITILTKIDYVSKSRVKTLIETTEKELECKIIGFSAKTRYGKDEVLKHFSKLLEK
ncbi:MAG: ribosome biogenesis GTP-binding protein YihA/YsxC [Cyanobacteriota bacterium]